MAKKNGRAMENPGIVLVVTYLVLFAVNSLVVHFANYFFPEAVVLGTQSITKGWALIHSMGTLALLGTFAIPFIREYEEKRGKMLSDKEWMVKYLIINFVGLWILSRFANNLGLGLASWRVVLVLALALDVAQGAAMMWVEKIRNS